MSINPLDVVEPAEPEPKGPKTSRLNAAVAITVALLATFMAICKVKDDNIVQAMQQSQADRIDHWAFYQARNLREEVAKSTAAQLRLQVATVAPQFQAAYREQITVYENLAKDQARKKEELRLLAEKDQTTYDALNFRDDQFDLSDALIALAIALLAVTALTQIWWLFGLGLVAAGFGVLMGVAGLAGWAIHPGPLISLLS